MPDTQSPEADASPGERLYRIGQVHLFGKRRSVRPPLMEVVGLWAQLEVERQAANYHLMHGGQLGLWAGLLALLAMFVTFAAPSIEDAMQLWPIATALIVAVAVMPVLWVLQNRWHISRRYSRYSSTEVRRIGRKLRILFAGLLCLGAAAFGLMALDTPVIVLVGGCVISGALFAAGLHWRTGRDPHCRRCWYPVGGPPSRWMRCSECGSDLSRPLAVVRGRSIHRPWLALVGVLGWLACTAGIAAAFAM